MIPSPWLPPWLRLIAAILAWLLVSPVLAADSGRSGGRVTVLKAATSFPGDALLARERKIPILVFYSRRDCPWCERVRREYLLPLANDPASAHRVLIRQIDIDGDFDTPLTDFSGRTTTHSAFARLRRAKLVPMLDFLDDRGNRLVEPIVGMRLPDYYGTFVERAIEESLEKLRGEGRWAR